ncbi:hypothetical protein [Streptomyces kebangsaanensis]|uniref:hypothetical protein n=1 Tax=Streptomyces kebangsaanensis TaxID=864058 RepID=UPI00093D8675|nr:hypothetical protein [Streptomyces kebangsaanensis]
MAIRPPENWRALVAQEARELAAGTLAPECAGMAELFPEPLLKATDDALQAFEEDVRALKEPSDEEVFGAIQRVVLDLNAINEDDKLGGSGYETDEREQLCEYIDRTLSEHGIDVAALAARSGMGRHEITDQWRDW